MPMELRLEFVAMVGSDLLDTKRKLVGNIADKVDRILVRVALVDFQDANTRHIIDSRVLIALEFLAGSSGKLVIQMIRKSLPQCGVEMKQDESGESLWT